MKSIISMILVVAGLACSAPAGLIGEGGAAQKLDIGYSAAMLAHVNEADALAAIKTWVEMVKEAWNSSVPSTTAIYSGTDKMKEALLAGRLDLVSVPIDEFFLLRQDVQLDHFLLGSYQGKTTVKNLLLVHRKSGIESLEALRGKNLVVSAADRLGMCELWLDTLLLEQGKESLTDYFSNITVKPKSSSAVHAVFFRTADACLVTKRNFDLITELNPQIGRDLVAIEVSPELVPAVVCMRASYDTASKQDLSKALLSLHETIRGQNMLGFFNSDKMVAATLDDLSSSLEMIERHEMLTHSVAAQAQVTMRGSDAAAFAHPEE